MKSLMKKQLLMGSILLVASSQVWADAASYGSKCITETKMRCMIHDFLYTICA